MNWVRVEPGVYEAHDAQGRAWQIRKEWRWLGGEAWRIFGPGQTGGKHAASLAEAQAKVARLVGGGLGDPQWVTSNAGSQKVSGVVAACRVPLEKKVGLIPNAKPYGCGAWGCVYPGKPGQAVKVLSPASVEEVQATLFVARLGARRPAELPRIYKVYQLGRCSAGAGGYVIVREDVGPIPDDLNLHAKATVKSDDVLQTLSSIELGKLSAFGDCAYLADFLGQVIDFGVSKVPEAEGLFRAAAALQVWGCEHGVEVTDTHPDNWGQRRDGSYVLRDFGATYGDPASRQDPSQAVTLNGLRRW